MITLIVDEESWQMSDKKGTGIKSDKKGTGIKSVVLSTLSAAFGVQKRVNQERDFQQGKPAHYITAGIVGTVLLVAILISLVHVVLQGK